MGVVLSTLLTAVWLSELLPQPDVNWDRVGVIIYVISALIELPSEPLWVMAQDTGHISIKVRKLNFSGKHCFRVHVCNNGCHANCC